MSRAQSTDDDRIQVGESEKANLRDEASVETKACKTSTKRELIGVRGALATIIEEAGVILPKSDPNCAS